MSERTSHALGGRRRAHLGSALLVALFQGGLSVVLIVALANLINKRYLCEAVSTASLGLVTRI